MDRTTFSMLKFLDPNRLCSVCARARHRPRACGFGHKIDLRVETYHDQIRTLHNFRPARPGRCASLLGFQHPAPAKYHPPSTTHHPPPTTHHPPPTTQQPTHTTPAPPTTHDAPPITHPPGDNGSNDVCDTCNLGGDLLSCSFCNVSYHNVVPCLPESLVIPASLVISESYEWPCPSCFKQAANTHQRKKLAPNPKAGGGQRKRKGRQG